MTKNMEVFEVTDNEIKFKDGNRMLRVTTVDYEITIEVNNGQGAFSNITLSNEDLCKLYWLGYK